MAHESKIEEAARIIGETAGQAKVILFGSHARGNATEDSDVDLLVIEPEVPDKTAETLRLRKAIRPLRLANDLLVYSEAEVIERQNSSSSAVFWALRDGKVLYDTLGG
ncbi:MAG: nucleotidyltransferase domain-containing protein [Nitrospinae bacterium]|nr:nucleotidyltransferase domain-containing protein [Nitrospinota bacterium]